MTRLGVAALVSLALCLLAGVSAADPQRKLESGRKALEAGDYERAAKDLAKGLEEAREDGAATGVLLNLNLDLADVYATYPDLGREPDAEPLYLEARSIAEQNTPFGHGARIEVLRRLGGYYELQGKHAQAIPVLEQFLKEAETAVPADRLYASQEASMLREAYRAVGNAEGVARMRKLAEDPAARRELGGGKVAEIPREKLYLEPNATAPDGAPIFVHVDPKVIPLRVSVALPDTPAADGTPEQTREAAIRGIREWEIAIQRLRPDFRLDFEQNVASAPIQVTWSDRPPGYTGGVGSVRAETVDGVTRALGSVILSAKPLPGRGETLTLGQVYANAVHAFGGALGLGYCQDCDSVRSMGWKLRNAPMRPTDLDLRTLEALLALENGKRAGDPPASEGVLADLPFVNTGDDRHIYVDIAKPGAAPFVVQLDTGAAQTVMTPLYARALGVATRAVKSDQHRRDSITGKPVLFWVTDQNLWGGGASSLSYALLGGSYLESYVVEIDMSRRRVRLLDPSLHAVGSAKNPRPHEQVVDMPVHDGCPHVTVGLGNGSVSGLLDTGAWESIHVTEEVAARLGIAVDPDAPRQRYMNVMATSLSAMQRVPSVKLGTVTLRDVELAISLRDSGVRIERMSVKDEMLVGLKTLRGFVARLDYPNQKLGLTPLAADAAP